MKKILFALCTWLTSVIAFGNNVYAQNYEKPDTFIYTKKFLSSVQYLDAWQRNGLSGISVPTEKNINIRAYKDFQVRYKEAGNAMWYFDSKSGFECYFMHNGYGNRVMYDINGRWLLPTNAVIMMTCI